MSCSIEGVISGGGELSNVVTGDLDVSNDASLLIGFGPQSHFCGQLRDVRIYGRAVSEHEIQRLFQSEEPSR